MSLKTWMARNFAGVSGYGNTMGREVVKNGVALGRTLYVGHGTIPTGPAVSIFENGPELARGGFTPYCPDPTSRPSLEDGSELSKHLQIAGITFAATCAFTAVSNCMKDANASTFTRSMGGTIRGELENSTSGIMPELLNQYARLQRPAEVTKVLNFNEPGTDDLLSILLEEAVSQSQAGPVGFQRRGVLGFDAIAITLAEETVKKIRRATSEFGW
jgi:hypothetical protein